jgi:hypothetical protein
LGNWFRTVTVAPGQVRFYLLPFHIPNDAHLIDWTGYGRSCAGP